MSEVIGFDAEVVSLARTQQQFVRQQGHAFSVFVGGDMLDLQASHRYHSWATSAASLLMRILWKSARIFQAQPGNFCLKRSARFGMAALMTWISTLSVYRLDRIIQDPPALYVRYRTDGDQFRD